MVERGRRSRLGGHESLATEYQYIVRSNCFLLGKETKGQYNLRSTLAISFTVFWDLSMKQLKTMLTVWICEVSLTLGWEYR